MECEEFTRAEAGRKAFEMENHLSSAYVGDAEVTVDVKEKT